MLPETSVSVSEAFALLESTRRTVFSVTSVSLMKTVELPTPPIVWLRPIIQLTSRVAAPSSLIATKVASSVLSPMAEAPAAPIAWLAPTRLMEVDPRSEPWFASDETPAPETNAEPNQFPNRLVDFVSDDDGTTAETTRLEVEYTNPASAVCKPTNAAAASAAAREIEPIFQTPCTRTSSRSFVPFRRHPTCRHLKPRRSPTRHKPHSPPSRNLPRERARPRKPH